MTIKRSEARLSSSQIEAFILFGFAALYFLPSTTSSIIVKKWLKILLDPPFLKMAGLTQVGLVRALAFPTVLSRKNHWGGLWKRGISVKLMFWENCCWNFHCWILYIYISNASYYYLWLWQRSFEDWFRDCVGISII